MHGPTAEPATPHGSRVSLGCTLPDLGMEQLISSRDMPCRRKTAQGRHRSHVGGPAQTHGLLAGGSRRDGHDRTGQSRGGQNTRTRDGGDIFNRDFGEICSADMGDYFGVDPVELSPQCHQNAALRAERPCSDLGCFQAEEDPALAIRSVRVQPDDADARFVAQLAVTLDAHRQPPQRGGGDTRTEAAHRLSPVALGKAQALLMTGLDKRASIARIAGMLEMSRNAFFKSFRETVGLSPCQWLLSQRVVHARCLLRTTDLPLVEIALTCGFSDQSHFTRIFKRIEGTSPGRWRQRGQ